MRQPLSCAVVRLAYLCVPSDGQGVQARNDYRGFSPGCNIAIVRDLLDKARIWRKKDMVTETSLDTPTQTYQHAVSVWNEIST